MEGTAQQLSNTAETAQWVLALAERVGGWILPLFSPAQWMLILTILGVNYALIYIVKQPYFRFVSKRKQNKRDIRMMVILCGILSTFLLRHDPAMKLQWYIVAIMSGPMTIVAHHMADFTYLMLMNGANWLSKGIPALGFIYKTMQYFYPILKGKEQRNLQARIDFPDRRAQP